MLNLSHRNVACFDFNGVLSVRSDREREICTICRNQILNGE